jgi:hypothetical protein
MLYFSCGISCRYSLGVTPLPPATSLSCLSLFYVVHCSENPIYVFPEKKWRDLSPNFDIHVSVSDFYILRIVCILLQENMWTDGDNL